jgi:hypothetical protein
LDRLHNGTTSNNISEDRDDDEDDRVKEIFFKNKILLSIFFSRIVFKHHGRLHQVKTRQ